MTDIDMSALVLGSCGPSGGAKGMTLIGVSAALLVGWAWVMTAIAVGQTRPAAPRTEDHHGR